MEQLKELAVLVARGERLADAAQRLGLDQSTAAEWAATSEFAEAVANMLPTDRDIRQQFMAEAARSVEVLPMQLAWRS